MNDLDSLTGPEAVGVLRAAADAGDVASIVELGRRLLVGRDAPFSPEEGVRYITRAAERHDAEALNVMATLSGGGVWGVPHSWPRALDYLVAAAEAGSADARAQLCLIAGDADGVALARTNGTPDIWSRLRHSVNLETWVTSPPGMQVCEAPKIWTAENFVSPHLCTWLLSRANGKFKVAQMRDVVTGTSRVLESRTCSDFVFDIVEGGVVMLLLRIKIAGVTEIPVPHMEPPQIFHYAIGQDIKAHYDFLRDGEKPYGRDGAYAGDRLATFLMYLNDGYGGGDLVFPKANYRYKGKAGDGIFFGSQRSGKPDPMSLHAALPVTQGEKFILSQWIHDRPFAA